MSKELKVKEFSLIPSQGEYPELKGCKSLRKGRIIFSFDMTGFDEKPYDYSITIDGVKQEHLSDIGNLLAIAKIASLESEVRARLEWYK